MISTGVNWRMTLILFLNTHFLFSFFVINGSIIVPSGVSAAERVFLFRIKSKSGCGGWCEKYLMLFEKVLPFISNFLSCTANHFSCLAAALSNVINCSVTSREKMEQFLSDFCHFSLA